MTRQTTRQTSSRFPETFPCPHCRRIVKVGEKFCGFCEKPLQVQCPACGDWTKANHRVCPQCGEPLHTGKTFAEKQQIARLQNEREDRIEERVECEQRLDDLRLERNYALIRLLVVLLVSVILLALIAPFVALVSALGVWGMVVVIVAWVVFGTLVVVLLKVYIHLCQWGSLFELLSIRQQIEREQAFLHDLNTDIAALDQAIASLKRK